MKLLKVSILTCIIVFVVVPQTLAEEVLTAEQWKQKADQEFSSKNFDTAIEYYGKAIEADPKNYLYFYQRGLVYTYRRRATLALKDFSSVLQLNPDHVASLTSRAKLYLELGYLGEAKADYEKIKSLPGSKADVATQGLANIAAITPALREARDATANKNWQAALGNWNTVLDVASSSEEFLLARATCLFELGNYQESVIDTMHVLRVNPKSLDAMWLQGQASFNMQDFPTAIEAYKRALKLDPENKKFSSASKLTKRVKNNLEKFNEQFNNQQWNDAGESWTALAKDLPSMEKDVNMLTKKCQIQVQTKKLSDAIQTCSLALGLQETFDAYLWRGEAYLLQDEFQKARNDFNKARQIQPNDHKLHDAFQRMERKEKMALRKDYYKILGVPRDADTGVIKKAYRKLAKDFHPDKHVSEEDKKAAEQKFLEVTEAYEVLSDEEARGRYDRGEDIKVQQQGNQGFNPFQGGFGGFPGGFKFTFH